MSVLFIASISIKYIDSYNQCTKVNTEANSGFGEIEILGGNCDQYNPGKGVRTRCLLGLLFRNHCVGGPVGTNR